MRVVALITCLIALTAAMPATAQTPELTMDGDGTYGTNITATVSNATPNATGVMMVGFTQGTFSLGHLATGGIASPILDDIGIVHPTGMLSKVYAIPSTLPAILTGQPLYFQAATVAPTVKSDGQFDIKLSTVQMIVLRKPAQDPPLDQ